MLPTPPSIFSNCRRCHHHHNHRSWLRQGLIPTGSPQQPEPPCSPVRHLRVNQPQSLPHRLLQHPHLLLRHFRRQRTCYVLSRTMSQSMKDLGRKLLHIPGLPPITASDVPGRMRDHVSTSYQDALETAD